MFLSLSMHSQTDTRLASLKKYNAHKKEDLLFQNKGHFPSSTVYMNTEYNGDMFHRVYFKETAGYLEI